MDFASMEGRSDVNPALNQAFLWSPTLDSSTDSSMAIPVDVSLDQPVDASEEIQIASTNLDAGPPPAFGASIPVLLPDNLWLAADVVNLSSMHLSQEQTYALNASIKFQEIPHSIPYFRTGDQF